MIPIKYQIKNYRWEVPVAVRFDLNDQYYVQDYLGHTKDVLMVLRKYIDLYYKLIKKFCADWDIDFKSFFRSLFLRAYYHDVGKLCLEFQRNIASNVYDKNFPHNIFALPIKKIMYCDKKVSGTMSENDWLGAIKTLKNSKEYKSILNISEDYIIKYDNDKIEAYSDLINYNYSTAGFDKYFILKFSPILIKGKITIKNLLDLMENVPENSSSVSDLRERMMTNFLDYIFNSSNFIAKINFLKILKQSSKGLPPVYGSVYNYKNKFFMPKLSLNQRRLKLNKEFQDILSRSKPYSVLSAFPNEETLRFCLSWGKKVNSELGKNRLLFINLLAAKDHIPERIAKYVSGNVKVFAYNKMLRGIGEYQKDPDYSNLISKSLKGSTFMYSPISIIELSQFLECFYYKERTELAFGNLPHSSVIFLGVPYYSKEKMKQFLAVVHSLSKLKIPYLIISLSVPGTFLKKIIGINPEAEYYESRSEIKFKPFTIISKNEKLLTHKGVNQNFFKTLKKHYKLNKNQLIVMNSISNAQRFYFLLQEIFNKNRMNLDDLVLVHPLFTLSDISKKNKMINELRKRNSSIVITTQRLFISPRIRFQNYYIETVPVDILTDWALYFAHNFIYKKPKLNLVLEIFHYSDSYPFRNQVMINSSKFMKNGDVSLVRLMKATDLLYNDLLETELKKFPEYLNMNQEDHTKQGLPENVNIIPSCLHRKKASKNHIAEDVLPIPLNLYKRLKGSLGKSFFIKSDIPNAKICMLPYSQDFGLIFPENAKPDRYYL